jgi:3-oxoacyl-ACP reductase-like protein
MSFFTRIKDAIFGKAKAAPAPAPTPKPSSPAGSAAPSAQPAPAPTPTPVVDVEAILTEMASQQSQKLNWRTSIVDLMKLVGLDSSLQNRKELAKELGYTGDMNDSASMNIWLHKQVMKKLAEHGGKVPADLKD